MQSVDKAHKETPLIIRSNIRHYEIDKYQKELQATGVMVEDWHRSIIISAVYSPSKYIIKNEQYLTFLKTLDNRFISAKDYNAKHTMKFEIDL